MIDIYRLASKAIHLYRFASGSPANDIDAFILSADRFMERAICKSTDNDIDASRSSVSNGFELSGAYTDHAKRLVSASANDDSNAEFP